MNRFCFFFIFFSGFFLLSCTSPEADSGDDPPIIIDPSTPRVLKTNGQWEVAMPQSAGTHTGIWVIEDLVRVGKAINDPNTGGNVWKLDDKYVMMADLDFTELTDYRNPDDTSIDADNDISTTGGIMAELTEAGPAVDGFQPIGTETAKFNGEFEGNLKTISNLYINRPTINEVGLWGFTDSNAIVTQLGLINIKVTGNFRVGALVGRNWGRVIQTYATGEVIAVGNATGGLVGNNTNSSLIEESYATGTITGINNIGGLIGFVENSIGQNNVAFTTEINGSSATDIARVVGEFYSGNILNNHANASVVVTGGTLPPASGADSVNGADMSAADFKDTSFYSNMANFNPIWNFSTVWQIKPSADRPTFIGSADDGLLSP